MSIDVEKLKNSLGFLQTLVDNITSGVFLLDGDVRVLQFNEPFSKIFSGDEQKFLGELCGNALGCWFPVTEGKPCGETSNCGKCELRKAIVQALAKDMPTFRQRLVRRFFIGGRPILKYFNFTTKKILHSGQEVVLVIVDDITTIEEQKESLLRKQAQIDQDLKAAWEIQKTMLPCAKLDYPSVSFAWEFEPCDDVGGDMIGVIPLTAEHVAMYVFDVCGHGVPAAMITVAVNNALNPHHGIVMRDGVPTEPAEVLKRLDEEFPYTRFERHFTMSYALMNIKTGKLLYSNAAHPSPFIIGRDGQVQRLSKGGTIVGLGKHVPFVPGRHDLARGDRIIMFTDGMTEYPKPPGHMVREEWLERELVDNRSMLLDDMLHHVLVELKKIGGSGRPADDMTMLAAEFRG